MSLLVVLPFYYGDEHLLLKNLEWMKELDGKLDYDCLLACDTETNVEAALTSAKQLFRNVSSMKYPRVALSEWPRPQNNAFLNTAWHIYAKHKGPWLWVETDSIPMCKGWLDALWAEYQKGGKPFGGHWNHATNVFNGVAIYPQNISQYSQKIMMSGLVENTDSNGKTHQPPWDVYGSSEVRKHLHVMNGLMQHIWQDDSTGEGWTFPDRATVEQVIRPGVVLFHRCKNESLVARLRESSNVSIQKAESADAVSLRRNGDIVSLLPLLKRMSSSLSRPVKLAVMREYAPLLEGVSYVDAVPCDGDMEDPLAFSERLNAVNAQVFGKRLHPDMQRSNFVKQAWLNLGHKWDRYAPLVFDRRDAEREAALASATFRTDKPKILVKLHGYSSPFSNVQAASWILSKFAERAELVNLDAVNAYRVFDLIGLMDRAACLVTVDTVTTHLAQASQCPTIQFTNDSNFGASPSRGNCIDRSKYHTLSHKARLMVIEDLISNCLLQEGNRNMVLVFNHWIPPNAETRRRQDAAYETWLKFPARLAPFPVKRSSVGLGDPRGMPFVRDMIAFALSSRAEDIVVISNNDIRFDEKLSVDMLASCQRFGCWWAYRTDHFGGPTDNGADVFAFTRKWWRIHEHLFPDFLLGYWWWDDVMVRMMRWSGCAEQSRLYYHEPHNSTQAPTRQGTPGAQHNERLANAWLTLHDERREKPT